MIAFIFLNGYYHKSDFDLIKNILKNYKNKRKIIAVDGGISFLQKIKIKPDIWIGDLDSAPRIKKELIKNTEIKIYPSEKDETDSELALDYCREKKISSIAIFGWYDRTNETDHLLGNILLPLNNKLLKSGLRIKFVDSKQEISVIYDDKMTYTGRKNSGLSIVPISNRVLLTIKGAKYNTENQYIKLGQTLSLRNKITSNRATVAVKGKALVIIKK